MAESRHSIELDPSTYAVAKRMAELEHVSIEVLLESLVRHRADYVDTVEQTAAAFRLADWEILRAPGESDEDFEARIDLFR